MVVPETCCIFAKEYMVQGKTIDETKAQALYSSEDTTSLGTVNPIGSEENNPPLDLRYDTAFKKIFSEKIFMIALLNSILVRTEKITDITYRPTESLPRFVTGKKVVFDLKCTLSTGEIIIVEMQYASQSYFKERALYYVARNIDSQLQRLDNEVDNARTQEEQYKKLKEYRIDPVCGIFITNFSLEKEERLMRDIWLTDAMDGDRRFSDKMHMVFLELPALKSWEECDSELKEWLYIINNSKHMEQIPFVEDKPIYKQLAEKARFANLTPEEQELYELDRRNEMAYMHSLLYAKMEAEEKGRAEGEAKGRAEGEAKGRAEGEAKGRAKGIAEGRAEGEAIGVEKEKRQIAQNLKTLGIDIQTIQKSTGLTVEEINNL